MKKFFILIMFIIVSVVFTGCTYKGSSYNKPKKQQWSQPKKKPALKEFRIRIFIENWIITNNVILDNAEDALGRVNADGRYLYFDEVVIKLKARKYPEKFWLVKLPQEKNGVFTLRANIKDDPRYLENIDYDKPPEKLTMVMVINDKKIVDHFFQDMRPWWGQFVFYKIDKKKKILYFKNNKFADKVWACRYPTATQGKFILKLKLLGR